MARRWSNDQKEKRASRESGAYREWGLLELWVSFLTLEESQVSLCSWSSELLCTLKTTWHLLQACSSPRNRAGVMPESLGQSVWPCNWRESSTLNFLIKFLGAI